MKNKELLDVLNNNRQKNDNKNEVIEFFEVMKNNNDYTFIWDSNNRDKVDEEKIYKGIKNRKHGKLNVLFGEMCGTTNLLFSVNSFNNNVNRAVEKNGNIKQMSRKMECLANIDCYYLDIDFKDNEWLREKNDDEIVNMICSIKEPTFIIHSGGGLHVYYKLTNGHVGYQTAKEIEKTIADYKKGIKTIHCIFKQNNIVCDNNATDVSRVLRVPYTINSKHDKYTRILYKYTQQSEDYGEWINWCKKYVKDNGIALNNKKLNKANGQAKKRKEIEYDILPTNIDTANTSYPHRESMRMNYDIYVRSILTDLDWLTQHKDYTGRRENILYLIYSLIKTHNNASTTISSVNNNTSGEVSWQNMTFTCTKNWDNINEVYWLNKLGEQMGLSEQEINNILKQKVRHIKITREKLCEIFGINEIDETYMLVCWCSAKEGERRYKVRYTENNKINNAKYNPINNAKNKEIRKANKNAKIENENNIVKELIAKGLNNKQISIQTGYSLSKVKRIKNRL